VDLTVNRGCIASPSLYRKPFSERLNCQNELRALSYVNRVREGPVLCPTAPSTRPSYCSRPIRMGLFDGSNLRQCRTDFALFIMAFKASALIIRNGTWPSTALAEPCLTPPQSILRPRERPNCFA
jgi:hypothetical protein